VRVTQTHVPDIRMIYSPGRMIVPLNSWFHTVSLPNKLIAYLLLVHPSASTRGPVSMMPRFSENERERDIIGIIERSHFERKNSSSIRKQEVAFPLSEANEVISFNPLLLTGRNAGRKRKRKRERESVDTERRVRVRGN
jgi:hypothetical protein